MAELKTRKLSVAQEDWFETSKSINLDGEKNIIKYAQQYTKNTSLWQNQIDNLLMRGNNINIYNLNKASKHISIYVNANNNILDMKEITNYVKNCNLRTLEIYQYSIDELQKVTKQYKKSSGLLDTGAGGTERHLYGMMYSIANKIKLSNFEQKLLDYTDCCRDKFFQRGVIGSIHQPLLPTEVNGELLTILVLTKQMRRDKSVMAAQFAGDILSTVAKNSDNKYARAVGNSGILSSQVTEGFAKMSDEWFIIPTFSVKVNKEKGIIRNYNESLINKDLKLLKDLIRNFDKFLKDIYKEYLDGCSQMYKKGSIFSFLSENHNMVSYEAMCCLNRETLGKVDQYVNTIESLLKFYSEIL